MRKALGWLLPFTVFVGTVSAAGATAGSAAAAGTEAGIESGAEAGSDIKDRIQMIPGMSLIEERPHLGYRFFVLNYTQPVDHERPELGTFQQRITLLHKDTSRPTVFHTSGYNVSTEPRRSEPTAIIDGNQVSLEYRYFTPSRPAPADWSKLNIWQAASDQHRVFTELKKIYTENWISTGASKGGMTATYYERFYPQDMDGVVAYVAPNDVDNDEDQAYDDFFENVGTAECRDKVNAVQSEALVRREPLTAMYERLAEARGYTFDTLGGLDRAYEAAALDYTWAFWQYKTLADCDAVPDAATATDEELFQSVDAIAEFDSPTDQKVATYTPYHYQAGTELGSPDITQPHLEGLTRYGYQPPRNFVPRDIPMEFTPGVMADVDSWVRGNAEHMMFVNGENDPWSAEPFRLGDGSRDSYVFTAPGANHGADVAALTADERAHATARILEWAGVAPDAVEADPATARPLAKADARLDQQDEEMTLVP